MFYIIVILSAVLAGMGIGGGAIFVLLANNLLDASQKEAQALNLILFVAVGASSTISNFKNRYIDFKIAIKSLPMLIAGSYIGTSLFRKINSNLLRKYFLYFLVIIGIYEIITSVNNMKKAKNNINESRKE